jgi:SpoVK/Ycf46/Vps4 family AAA+-type ATPase
VSRFLDSRPSNRKIVIIVFSEPGRTRSAYAIAAASGIPSVLINGMEIASKGNQAGHLLRSILEEARNRESKVVVIIDNADSIITSRSNQNDRCNRNPGSGPCEVSSGNCCLYLLLEYMREARLGLSLIVTTSLDKLTSIDTAFLDR